LSGALAIIDEQADRLVADLPAYQLKAGRKTRTELDLGSLRQLLLANPRPARTLEEQGSVPNFIACKRWISQPEAENSDTPADFLRSRTKRPTQVCFFASFSLLICGFALRRDR
jgi:hypothetical protein